MTTKSKKKKASSQKKAVKIEEEIQAVAESHATQVEEVETTLQFVEEEVQYPMPSVESSIEKYDKLEKETKPKIDPNEVDPKIKQNVDARKAAEDVLDLIATELPEEVRTHRAFWEPLRTEALKQLKELPKQEQITPLDDETLKDVLRRTMPRGPWKGKTLATVLKKERQYLYKFAAMPSHFQKLVLRVLESTKSKKN